MRLSTHLTVAMVVLVLLTALAVGLMINRSIEERALPHELDGISTHARLLATELDGSVRGARTDVTRQGQSMRALVDAILAGDHPRDDALQLQARDRLASRFVVEVSAKPSYSHFRLIGIRDGGREIVRVDRRGPDGAIRVLPDAELKRRSDRDYFKAAIKLPAGEVHVSPLGFYEEAHRASTLRVAASVLAADGSLDPDLLLLAKPYRAAELAHMVRRALDLALRSQPDERRPRLRAL
jgi:hypothetical protein